MKANALSLQGAGCEEGMDPMNATLRLALLRLLAVPSLLAILDGSPTGDGFSGSSTDDKTRL